MFVQKIEIYGLGEYPFAEKEKKMDVREVIDNMDSESVKNLLEASLSTYLYCDESDLEGSLEDAKTALLDNGLDLPYEV